MAITKKTINDITAQNLGQVPSIRGNMPIQWIVIHYLGVANADNPYLYGGGYGGHYNITRDGTIYKAADPRTAVTWHCGGGLQGSGGHQYHGICTNYNSIGIENGVCYDGTWYFTTETQESLVYLVSTLMDEYGIDINHVIRHYDVTGKNCPAPYVENNGYRTNWTWDQFKSKLAAYRKGGTVTQPVSGIGASAWKAIGTATCTEDGVNIRRTPAGEIIGRANKGNRFEIDGKVDGNWTHIKIAGAGIGWMWTEYVKKDGVTGNNKSYMVRITISDLRIRKGPGTNYASVGYIAPGAYTIVEESSGQGATKWGKLKSGAGWISLDYCTKI